MPLHAGVRGRVVGAAGLHGVMVQATNHHTVHLCLSSMLELVGIGTCESSWAGWHSGGVV